MCVFLSRFSFWFFVTERFYVLTTFYNVSEMSLQPETGGMQHVMFNHKTRNDSECTHCSLKILYNRSCPEWHPGPMADFLKGLQRGSTRRLSGTWTQSARSRGGFDIRSEFDDYVIFGPSRLSSEDAAEKCRSLNYSLLTLTDRGEEERFRALYDQFYKNISTRSRHHTNYPVMHFMNIATGNKVGCLSDCLLGEKLFIPRLLVGPMELHTQIRTGTPYFSHHSLQQLSKRSFLIGTRP
jgi:hypothetical protein